MNKAVQLTDRIARILGKYYDNLYVVSQKYTQKWLDNGFDEDVLPEIAEYCFKKNLRSIDKMDVVVYDFYKKGVVSIKDFKSYVLIEKQYDAQILNIFTKLGISRDICSFDRNYYSQWVNAWNFSDEMIDYAVSISDGCGLSFINTILARFNVYGITSVEDAKSLIEKKNPSIKIEGWLQQQLDSRQIGEKFESLDEKQKQEALNIFQESIDAFYNGKK